jgi:hypothetical protein
LDPNNQFNPTTCLCLSQVRISISNGCMRWAWFELRDCCLFLGYWWIYLPSLFTLSFHNFLYIKRQKNKMNARHTLLIMNIWLKYFWIHSKLDQVYYTTFAHLEMLFLCANNLRYSTNSALHKYCIVYVI